MTLTCSVSSAAPATTNAVIGFVNSDNIYLDLNTASVEDKKIVSDFINVIGNHLNVDILDYNGSGYFEATIVIPGEADIEAMSIEYPTLTEVKKTDVDAFVNLINSLVPTN